MFFTKLFAISAVTSLAVSTSIERRSSALANLDVWCCQLVVPASDPTASAILGLLGIESLDPNVTIGITCSRVSTISDARACPGTLVICEDTSHGELFTINCTPVQV
ncbi:hypothetical protein L218DRAFT_999815 [Marasmius fiardii PR-910]|nr:hypothetical protein L218DRAFT_999815 [Marasmius fiardii PR-910]